jgi:hypothetical protein
MYMYNQSQYWAALFLGEINTGTWSSRLGSLKFETVKYGHESGGTRTREKTKLARPSSNCKQQIHPLIREETPCQKTNCLKIIKRKEETLAMGPRWVPDTKKDWTIDHWS